MIIIGKETIVTRGTDFMKTKILQVRIEEDVKNEAEAIFKNIGLDLSTGVRLYLNRVVKEKGIPFSMKEEEGKNESPDK